MSAVRFLNTLEMVVAGFESRRPTKRDLLSNSVAALLASPDELREVVDDLEERVRGVLVTLEEPLRFEQLGTWLWRLRAPPHQLDGLRELLEGMMQAVEQGARLDDERIQLQLERHSLSWDLSETRRVYNEATARLQRQVAEVTRLNRDLDQRLKEQIASQAEREHLEEQLRQSQKLEAIGHLAGGIAHDFNNLLVAILGHAELAVQGLDEASPLREELEHVTTAAQRAATLTQQLLAFSRRQILQPVDLDLAEVVDELVTMLDRILGEDVELKVRHTAAPTTVRVDRGQLEQVLLNLCVNARDAMPTGGEISIETGREDLDAADCATRPWATPGRYATLRVRDTGSGMDGCSSPSSPPSPPARGPGWAWPWSTES